MFLEQVQNYEHHEADLAGGEVLRQIVKNIVVLAVGKPLVPALAQGVLHDRNIVSTSKKCHE